MPQKPVRTIQPHQSISDWTGQLFKRHETLWFFLLKDLKVQYSRPWLGLLWSVFQPLVYFGIILTVMRFTGRTGTVSRLPFPVFLISGLAIWNFTTSSILGSMSSIRNNAGIISRSFFPRFYLVLAPVIKSSFDLLIVLIIVVAISVYYGLSIQIEALYLWPAMLVMAWSVSLGLSALAAASVAVNRHVRHAVPVLLYAMIFMLPVFYSVQETGNRWLYPVYRLNPIAGSMDCLRAGFGAVGPSANDTVCWLALALVCAIFGIFIFRRAERTLADRI